MQSNSKENSATAADHNRSLILIVDNDQDNLLLASYIIESMGMNYVVTNDSEQCLNLVKRLSPGLILLDIVMPKMNGLEIISIIKQDADFSHIPIVAVTGLTKTEDKNKLIAAGFDAYLGKPYLIEELESIVHRFFKRTVV